MDGNKVGETATRVPHATLIPTSHTFTDGADDNIVASAFEPNNRSSISTYGDTGDETTLLSDGLIVHSEQYRFSNNEKTIGVAATGAIVGTLLLGPAVGVLAAGAAVYASTRDDSVGEAAKSVGDVACQTYSKLSRLAQHYHVKENATAAFHTTAGRLREINDEYKVAERAAATGWVVVTYSASIVSQGVAAGVREIVRMSNSSTSSTRH